jgi:hypothetical protein
MTEERRELNERDLDLVVGGGGDPTDPVADDTGGVEANSKATPVVL